jgi:serine/threonine-protein kinase HipA
MLFTKNLAERQMKTQLGKRAEYAQIIEKVLNDIMTLMLSKPTLVEAIIVASFLNNQTKRSYLQPYLGRLKQLLKV